MSFSCAFRASSWLPNGHWETFWAPILTPVPRLPYRREVWSTPDSDRIAADWVDGPKDRPIVVLFHGLASSSRGHYAQALAMELRSTGWRGCFINFRGCGGLPNLQPRSYHAGDSPEIAWILDRIRQDHPAVPLYAVGVSLGGNVLLKYLGETGQSAPLDSAAAVCAPVDLPATAEYLEQGYLQFYHRHFLFHLKRGMGYYRRHFPGMADWNRAARARTLREFDDAFTAPVHGFSSVQNYWEQSSSGPFLQRIRIRCLLINSRNDPIVPIDQVRQWTAGTRLRTCFTSQGGHVGYVQGSFPGNLRWLPQALLRFFQGDEPDEEA